MAQLDPQLLATLMPNSDGLDDQEYKEHIEKMTEEERMEEAIQRNKMDNDITDLYMECFTDKHLDLAALLMEQHSVSERDPELVLTDAAKRMIAWAKAVVSMQLILLATQSAMSDKSRKEIEKLSRSGQEVIALNYKRCKSDIDQMLVELADASASVEKAQNDQLHGGATVQELHTQIQDMEKRMRAIVVLLEENKASDTEALDLAIEYAALKAGSNAIAADTKLQDPQKALLDDWMIKNYTPPLQEAATSVLAGSAYPELKTWANAMDAVKAFTSTQTVAMLNELLLKVGNEVKDHRTDIENFLLSGQTPSNKTRKRLPGGFIDYNTDAIYFIKDLATMDENDWNDAAISLPSTAVAAARSATEDPNYDASGCKIDEWLKTTVFLSQFVTELSKNMHTISEQRDLHSNLIITLLHTSCSLYDEFKAVFKSDHLKLADGVQQGSYLYQWASAILAISKPPPYSIFDAIASANQKNPNLIESHPKEDIIATHDAALYLKSMVNLQPKEWTLVSKTIEAHITDSNIPPEAAEWGCAAVELKGYLKTTQENMRKIVTLYQKYSTDIDTLQGLMPSPPSKPASEPPKVRQSSLEPSTPVPEIGKEPATTTPLAQPSTATPSAPLNASQETEETVNDESPGPVDENEAEDENEEGNEEGAQADTEDDGPAPVQKDRKVKKKKKKNSTAGVEGEGGEVVEKKRKKKKRKSLTGATGDDSSCTASPSPTPTGARRKSSAKAKMAAAAAENEQQASAPSEATPTQAEEAPKPEPVEPVQEVKEVKEPAPAPAEPVAETPAPAPEVEPVKEEAKPAPTPAPAPAPEEESTVVADPKKIEVKPLEDSPPSAPVPETTPDARVKDDVYQAKRVVVQPAKPQVRTIREAVHANPNIAAGIIFVKPKEES
eukprot:TRINITY_DN3938_c1_g1_i1.p1 TRINITY_DN3938_c1_g1~~TRINITY_DN3938_c1_g1_i1.p1  ORF type:complete len:897 (+),score=233.92 TRINITY_DN3938_c1_g1_i1:37-2727(+)